MVVEEERRPVEPDGGLAGARAALDGQELVERRPDDLVLLGLDGGDDVEHLAGAGPLELGQEGVAATQPRSCWSIVPGPTEEVVGHGHDRAAIDHDLAATGKPEGVLGTGPVEGHGDGRPPVDDDRDPTRVSSTCRRPMCQVGPSSSSIRPKRSGRGLSARSDDPPREGGHVVEVGVPGARRGPPAAVRPVAASLASDARA